MLFAENVQAASLAMLPVTLQTLQVLAGVL
jgi:hypothetical protein